MLPVTQSVTRRPSSLRFAAVLTSPSLSRGPASARYIRATFLEETPGAGRPGTGVVDADARRTPDRTGRTVEQDERPPTEIGAVAARVDTERLANLAGAVRERGLLLADPASLCHE